MFCRLPVCCAGAAGDGDLRQVILRLDQVELRLVRRIVAADLRVGDVDLGLDLLVQQLGLGQRAAQVALQIVEGDVARLELLVELLLACRAPSSRSAWRSRPRRWRPG